MPKVNYIQTNLSGGEISPLLRGRTDLPRYLSGLAESTNFLELTTGGATRRPGTYFVIDGGLALIVKLIPIVIFRLDLNPPRQQGYIVEIRSNGKIRFYTNNQVIKSGALPYEISHPYAAVDISKINYAPNDNMMHFTHPDVPLQELSRISDTNWQLTEMSIIRTEPVQTVKSVIRAQIGAVNYTIHRISVTGSVVTTHTVTVETDLVHDFQIDDTVEIFGSETADFNGPQTVVATASTSFDFEMYIGIYDFHPPQATNSGMYCQKIGGSGSQQAVVKTDMPHGFATGATVTMAGATPTDYNGDKIITVTDPQTFTYPLVSTPETPATGTITAKLKINSITRSGSTATVSLTKHNLADGDTVTISGATQAEYNITAVITYIGLNTFSYQVSGTPATPATGSPVLQAGDPKKWSVTNGFPAAITFSDQRMITGGTKLQPQTIWGSKSGDKYQHTTGTGDSDPFEVTLEAANSNIIHLTSGKLITALTYAKELTIQGSSDKPLTPTNMQIKERSPYGTAQARPFVICDQVIFATKHKRKLRELGYNFESDRYKAVDISIMAAHLAGLGIEDMAYTMEPYSIIWIVTTAGDLLAVTYDQDAQVIAWSRCVTDGHVTAVAVIPHDNVDQVWIAVNRTIDGVAKTYIEYIDYDLMTDSTIVLTAGSPTATWAGLNHLEGKTVDIIADGVIMPQQTVDNGQITLQRAASQVEIGLHYDSDLIDLPPEFQTGAGTAQAGQVSINKITVRLHETLECEINGEPLGFRTFGTGVLDRTAVPFTGDKDISNLGWGKAEAGVVHIKQKYPLPCTVLAIIKEVTVN